MDGLIILLFFVFIGSMIAKRAKQPVKTQNEAHRQVNTQTRAEHSAHQRTQPRNDVKKPSIEHTMSSRTEPAAPHQIIQPTLQTGNSLYNYTGSLGVASNEGEPSAEGNSNDEGGEVFSRDVLYAAQNAPATSPMETLPEDWDGPALVRAVVMNEIFNKPHRWSGYRG